MSFSTKIKNELKNTLSDMDKKFACLYGIILLSKKVNSNEISFQTESDVVAKLFPELVSQIFKNKIHFEHVSRRKKNGVNINSFTLKKVDEIELILKTFKIEPDNLQVDISNIDNNNLGIFIAGIFLVSGSCTDPNKEYHLEFVFSNENICNDLNSIFKSIGINIKSTIRKKYNILYLKESENIEDILTFMGAQLSTLDLINIKIQKDMRNRVNRIANCDVANYGKTIDAAIKQKQDIEFIDSTIGLENITKNLREMAYLRLENPELSLKELGEKLQKPIGRSGVNHRLKNLSELAQQIRNGTYEKKL